MQDNFALKTAYDALDDKFGKDIHILDIRTLSVLTDYFIVATGSNASQIQAMADAAAKALSKHGLSTRHIEGYHSAQWILMDFNSIIIHIFDEENRAFYNIEHIWSDAKHIDGHTL
jgi:ribosome-associated protein